MKKFLNGRCLNCQTPMTSWKEKTPAGKVGFRNAVVGNDKFTVEVRNCPDCGSTDVRGVDGTFISFKSEKDALIFCSQAPEDSDEDTGSVPDMDW